jgi:TolB-like protein/Flp pilus assembly protein TadD
MFTDIVGYTALMGSDEDGAFELLRKNRDIHQAMVTEFNGTIVKEIGDGMLISFHLSSEAVRCAIEIQKACRSADIPLKIGIHEGEVVFEGIDVLGDNVNIASRLQDNTQKGNINISDSVYRNIRNKADIRAVFIDETRFKNVKEPVKVYRILIDDEDLQAIPEKPISKRKVYQISIGVITLTALVFLWIYWCQKQGSSPTANSDISIAVLPFINIGNDPEQEYFSDGMTEEIIIQLAKIGKLSVISRTSVFQFKNQQTDLKTIGKKLNTSYILEGSVRRENNRLRISTQLVDVATDQNIWAEVYDRDSKEVLDIQSEVAKHVANALGITLNTQETKRIDRKSTINNAAYEFYLKAVHEDKNWTAKGAKKAVGYLENALEIDPRFSEAYSLYAWQYVNLATLANMSVFEAVGFALPAIQKAVALDPQSSDAWLVYGAINFYLQWDFDAARVHYEKSMELNSWGEAPIYQCICAYTEFLMVMGQYDKIREMSKNIRRIDPAYFLNFAYESILHSINNEPEQALASFEKTWAYADNNNSTSLANYGTILFLTGRFEQASLNFEKAISLNEEDSWITRTWLGMSYLHTGNETEALEILEELLEMDDQGVFGMKSNLALLYYEMGNEEQTFKYLKEAMDSREPNLLFYISIYFRNLKGNQQYQTLMQEIGLEV